MKKSKIVSLYFSKKIKRIKSLTISNRKAKENDKTPETLLKKRNINDVDSLGNELDSYERINKQNKLE